MPKVSGIKTCPKCKETKPHSGFYRNAGKPTSYCKPCQQALQKRTITPDIRRGYWVKSTYGLTMEAVAEIIRLQGGGCAICRKPVSLQRSSIDHCHDTNRIRGVLCFNCNVGIGNLGDDIAGLEAALAYLRSPTVDIPVTPRSWHKVSA